MLLSLLFMKKKQLVKMFYIEHFFWICYVMCILYTAYYVYIHFWGSLYKFGEKPKLNVLAAANVVIQLLPV